MEKAPRSSARLQPYAFDCGSDLGFRVLFMDSVRANNGVVGFRVVGTGF